MSEWVLRYHNWKNKWSEFNALFSMGERSPLPRARDVYHANALLGSLVYTGDGLGGVLDHYQHPERVMWRVEQGTQHRLPVDCDDYGLLAWAMLTGGGYVPTLYCLVDAGLTWTHVICVVHTDYGRILWSLDTNGLHQHVGHQKMIDFFSEKYPQARYIDLVSLPVPFKGEFRFKP